MNPRMLKEYRPLLLPWGVGVSAGLAGLLAEGDRVILFTLVYYACAAVLAAMVFGLEFQHRTMPLLLTQPMSRLAVWKEKLGVAGFGVGTLAVLDLQFQRLVSRVPALAVVAAVVVLVALIGGWGILAATRSLLWSLVIGVCGPLLLFGGVTVAVYNYSELLLVDTMPEFCVAVIATGMVCCAILAYLGQRFLGQLARNCLAPMLVVLLFSAGQVMARDLTEAGPNFVEVSISVLVLLIIVCSTFLWTLLARSTIGGLAFTIAGPFLPALGLGIVIEQLSLGRRALSEAGILAIWILASLGYALLCLWLGWKKFARLEWREVSAGANLTEARARANQSWLSDWLRCRPRGSWRNLVRKELRLHKPVFLLATVFTVCWAAALGVQVLWPQVWMSILFVWLGCIYVPAALLLAGTVSLGEERTLGLAAWHLTLPIPPWQSWLAKLATAAFTAAALGALLPGLLFMVSSATAQVQFPEDVANRTICGFAAICGATLFLLGFWAAGFTGNTIRAALIAVPGLGVAYSLVMLNSGLEQNHYLPPGGLALGVMQYFDNSWAWGPPSPATWALIFAAPIACVIAVILLQSLAQFRRAEAQRDRILRNALVLAAVVAAASFWCGDMATAFNTLSSGGW